MATQRLLLPAGKTLPPPDDHCPGLHTTQPSVAFTAPPLEEPEPGLQAMGTQALSPPAEKVPDVQARQPSVALTAPSFMVPEPGGQREGAQALLPPVE